MADKTTDVLIAEISTNLINFKGQLDAILTNQESIFEEQSKHGKTIEAIKGDVQRIAETGDLKLQAVRTDLKSLETKLDESKLTITKNSEFRNRLEGMAWILEKTPILAIISAIASAIAIAMAWIKQISPSQ